MKSGSFILDTNIVIYLLRDKLSINDFRKYYVSVITEMELLSYPQLSKEDEEKVKQIVNQRNVIEIDKDIKDGTISIRKQYHIKLPDSIICATAKTYNLVLVTEDEKLHNIKGLKIISYKQLLEYILKN